MSIKELIKLLLEKWTCKHDWKRMSDWLTEKPRETVYDAGQLVEWHAKLLKTILVCKKCGSLKTIYSY